MSDDDDFDALFASMEATLEEGAEGAAAEGAEPEPEAPPPTYELPSELVQELEGLAAALDKLATAVGPFLKAADSRSGELVATIEAPEGEEDFRRLERQVTAWEGNVVAPQVQPFTEVISEVRGATELMQEFASKLKTALERPAEAADDGDDGVEPEAPAEEQETAGD